MKQSFSELWHGRQQLTLQYLTPALEGDLAHVSLPPGQRHRGDMQETVLTTKLIVVNTSISERSKAST